MAIGTAAKRAAIAQVREFIKDRLEFVSPVDETGRTDQSAVIYALDMYRIYREWYRTAVHPEWVPGEERPDRYVPLLTMTAFGRAMGQYVPKVEVARGREYRGVRVKAA